MQHKQLYLLKRDVLGQRAIAPHDSINGVVARAPNGRDFTPKCVKLRGSCWTPHITHDHILYYEFRCGSFHVQFVCGWMRIRYSHGPVISACVQGVPTIARKGGST